MLIFQNLFQLLAKAVLVSAFTSVRICRYAKNRNGQKCFSWILLSYISDAMIFFQSVLALPFSFPNNIITLRCCTFSLYVGKKECHLLSERGKKGSQALLRYSNIWSVPAQQRLPETDFCLPLNSSSHEVTSFFFFFSFFFSPLPAPQLSLTFICGFTEAWGGCWNTKTSGICPLEVSSIQLVKISSFSRRLDQMIFSGSFSRELMMGQKRKKCLLWFLFLCIHTGRH